LFCIFSLYNFIFIQKKLTLYIFFSIFLSNMNDYDDFVFVKRSRGKDKAKERYYRNGGFSSKHLRIKQREHAANKFVNESQKYK